ncbi:MAG: acetate/propionate family kinase [Alicyclobacillus sp.]|nr:acetate/propionate family kinase [Alicyclobacillus sp.]
MNVPVGVSARHIHLTQEHADMLFGKGYSLQRFKPLRQPGQFACQETVTLRGPKGSITNVRVLGPLRDYSQVEISKTDAYVLGVTPPVRDSGDIEGTPGIEVVGPNGTLELKKGVILAHRHIHMHPSDAAQLGVRDKDFVCVETKGERQVILERVLCRVSPNYALEFHIDTDEANASGLSTGDVVKVIAVDATHELRTFVPRTVLVLNCGSSSVKYKLYEMPTERIVSAGNFPRSENRTLEQTLNEVFATVGPQVDVVAHRIVHGADLFASSVLITPDVLEQIRSISYLAPLHNPVNLQGVEIAQRFYPGVPHVAVFDTSFHQTMPPESYLYPIPYEYYEKHKIRKYGFHGSSHRYVMERAEQMLDVPRHRLRLISCHIGNGVSVTAIRNGESYSTSMGLTPLSGVAMGTRSGNIDPAVIPLLAQLEGMSDSEVLDVLNSRSGLLGVSGVSNDVRVLLEHERAGNERAHLAIELFVSKLHNYIGLSLARLNGADALIFTAGIGENSPEIREKICQGLEYAGIYLDSKANWEGEGERVISSQYSPIKVMVIPTNEEIIMARDAYWMSVEPASLGRNKDEKDIASVGRVGLFTPRSGDCQEHAVGLA